MVDPGRGRAAVILADFVRIVTNAKIFERPAPAALALDFVDRLVAAPRRRWLSASEASWTQFGALVRDDAWMAAAA